MTLKETLEHSTQKRGDHVLMRFKRKGRWEEWTYRQFLAFVRNVSEALARTCHVRPGDRVALMGANSPEWCAIHYGITSIAATAVPIDVKLQEQEVAHILSDSGASTILMDSNGRENILDVAFRCPNLRHVVLFGKKMDLDRENSRGIKIHDYEAIVGEAKTASEGHNAAYDRYQPKEDTVAAFIYTSGTTGRQKGAMLTHKNFTSNFQSLDAAIDVFPDDNFLVILPLHHAFAFTTCLVTPIASGTQLSFIESLRTISENIRETRPTIILGVPLLLEKMYNKMLAGIKSSKTVNLMWKMGIRGPIKKGILDKLGGRVRLMISGGAPVDPLLISGLEELGLHPREGYGLTECSPVLSLTPYEGPIVAGSCGKVLPFVEMKVFDPNSEGVGELAVQGDNVMKGYYNNLDATEEAFRDGWLLTGDLGYLDENNFVHITGRKKALIVNREGKNIYPEEVELQINNSPLILECVVLGYRDSEEAVGEHVGVIVVPDEEGIAALEAAERRKFTEKELDAHLRNEVKRQVAHLADYKHPRRIQVRWEEFNKTATGKIKRYLYAM
ncbi:MAG: AMP-binding protein [Verrucomicrobiota bacterium]|jgi:long-chain acyl-CoA synthetase|nr:AMP-binding protein [Verrucomicrobiota bacterium]